MAVRATSLMIVFTACCSTALFGQAAGGQLEEVPFVGCPGEAQMDSFPPPTRPRHAVRIEHSAARKLAYYQAEGGTGVLGPRGWSCLNMSGSGGSLFLVMPDPID